MTQPEGEATRKALRWISQRRKDEPSAAIGTLIDQASRRFDLSPMEQEALLTWLSSRPKDAGE